VEQTKTLVIRCRGIILYNDKLLVVKHYVEADFFALPGGHLEWGEKVFDCIKREITEELGIEPKIGRLLYINNLTVESSEGKQSIEFFFEILNSADYSDLQKLNGTHKDELIETCWIGKNDSRKILPNQVQLDLNNGSILSNTVRFI
jgi:ADP-ribose pyrophosphatase YjhB (NUDIX family)